jgi:hypothetical protein
LHPSILIASINLNSFILEQHVLRYVAAGVAAAAIAGGVGYYLFRKNKSKQAK